MSLVSYCCVPRASIRFRLAGLASKKFSLEREESYFYDHGTEIELSLELERGVSVFTNYIVAGKNLDFMIQRLDES